MCYVNSGLNIPIFEKEMSAYDSILSDIKNYNRADTVNMSELEMNKFRHIAGPAYLTQKLYSPEKVNTLGFLKEAKDFLQGRGWNDGKYDFNNNQKGIEIGKAFKNTNISQKALFDYIFRTEIQPYRK